MMTLHEVPVLVRHHHLDFQGKTSSMKPNQTILLRIFLPVVALLTAQGQVKQVNVELNVPHALKAKADAMGPRFSTRGNERTVIAGTMTRPGSASVNAVVSYEIPRQMRYEEPGKSLIHDGQRGVGQGPLADSDASVLESLLEDSMDGLLYTMPKAQLFRPLMNRARLDDGKAPNYIGPYVDIYEIALPVLSLGNTVRRKHFYFDSKTHLLDRVVYFIGLVRVETRFQNWRLVSGSPIPGTVSRSENGLNKFTFTPAQINIGPAQADRAFLP